MRRLSLVAVAAASVAFGFIAYLVGAWPGLENASVDLRFSVRGSSRPADVVMVAIDDETLSALNRSWPLPRRFHARVIDELHAAGARQIVYDVQFTEPTTPSEDWALYSAIGRAGGAVLATTAVDSRGHTDVLGGDANLARVHAVAAEAYLPQDSSGVIRRYDRVVNRLPTIAAATAARVQARPPSRMGRPAPPLRFDSNGAWIDFRGRAGTIRTVSFSDLYLHKVDPHVFAGKVVVVGVTAPTLQDMHPTAVGGGPMSGAEVQANAIWTALHGNPLRDGPGWLAILAILGAGLAAPVLAMRWSLLAAMLAGAVGAAAYGAASQQLFDSGTVVPITYPLAAWFATTVGMLAASYLDASVEGRNVSLRARMLEGAVMRRDVQLREAQLEIVHRLAVAAESRDGDTGEHVHRVGKMCERLARAAGMPLEDAELLRDASAMHDVGKIGIPDDVLRKPGPLNIEERDMMETHAARGAEILAGSSSPLIRMAETVAMTHHERWDGTGYPRGLRGEEIPLAGRIVAICDVFDALCSQRPYKESWTVDDALAEIERSAGDHFDPALVAAFMKIVPGLVRELRLAPGQAQPDAPGSVEGVGPSSLPQPAA